MITRFKVDKLHGNPAWNFDFSLHKDINVFTGKNGAGKTTVLKLLWYLVSGNIERIFPEITFGSALIEGCNADGIKFSLQITVDPEQPELTATIDWSVGDGQIYRSGPLRLPNESSPIMRANADIAVASGSSVFFPTFRRIEGGFSLSTRPRSRIRRMNQLQEGMSELSEELSNLRHSFVSSIATYDIESLLTTQVAKNSDITHGLQEQLTTFIKEAIKIDWNQIDSTEEKGSVNQAREILSRIEDKVKDIESAQTALMKPFTVLSSLVQVVLKHKGLRLKEVVTFGDVVAAIDADHLSAGEKQMFSFLCYNAFQKGAMIFIDEPEISLHVDWQRILFPKLMEQASDNQFIITTHSPFIYSKYSDRELNLTPDKGDHDE